MDPAKWPGIIEMMEGWWNQPIPAKTATMWYAELRHYDEERVLAAMRVIVTTSESPWLPPLGVVLKVIRTDGTAVAEFQQGTLDRFKERMAQLTERTDQFLDREGMTDEQLEAYFSPGTMCAAACGGVGTTTDDTHCFFCGAELVADTRPPELGGPVVPNRPLLGAGAGGSPPEMVPAA